MTENTDSTNLTIDSVERHDDPARVQIHDAVEALLSGFLQGLYAAISELIDPTRMAPEQALYFFVERQLSARQADIVEATLLHLAHATQANEERSKPANVAADTTLSTDRTGSDVVDRACQAIRTTAGPGITSHLIVHGMLLRNQLQEDDEYWAQLSGIALRNAFRSAIEALDTNSRTKTLLIRLFDGLVIDGLQAVPPPETKASPDDALTLLPIGTWVRYLRPGQEPLICRLQLVDETDQRLIFVNQSGFEVLALPAPRVESTLQAGALTIMTEADLLQRALQAMHP